MNVKIVNKSKHKPPHYATNQSAGMDLRANLDESITLNPLARVLVKTGLFIDPYFSATKIKWILDNVKVSKKLIKTNN